jgi:hypothetical protein
MKAIATTFSITLLLLLGACSSNQEDPYAPCTEFDQLDLKMTSIMDEIREKHANNRLFLKAFEMEHVYWIQYRDRRLRAMYPKDWNRYYRKEFGKEVFNSCKCEEYVRSIKIRIKELEMYLNGGPSDQQDCPSMMSE